MNVRRFTAVEMKQALAMVRKTLGEDAVILKTRKVKKGGWLSFMSKEMIEVTAASPDRKVPFRNPSPEKVAQVKRDLDSQSSVEVMQDLQEEIKDLKGHVQELSEQVKFERMPSLPRHLAKFYKRMVLTGVDERVAKEFAQVINLEFKGDELEDDALVERALIRMLSNRLTVRYPHKSTGNRARIIVLIGPTGVGKTTTLAKLVTSHRYWGQKDTALVSIDTYRIAAIEQLKTFASIAGLPMEAVYKPAAFRNVLERHSARDAIFVDSAGRSQVDSEKLDELEQFLDAAEPDEVLLCLSVSTRLEDQLEVIRRYGRLKPTGIVFTKLDESNGPGLIISTMVRTRLPVTYLTCGQNVPDDIFSVNPRRIAEIILKPETLKELQETRFEAWIKADGSTN
ncbi:flagellar biosynthesis protein FlhF [bacterium]|nr:flagellar biosynthesis protein FlhF [bacterium]